MQQQLKVRKSLLIQTNDECSTTPQEKILVMTYQKKCNLV